MARLSLSLLGPFEARLDGELVAGFESDKVRALLAYLAVESDRPHRRETLAGLLWPDWPDRAARKNLSGALYNLRTAIGDRRAIGDRAATPPFLLIDRETIRFSPEGDHWLDVSAFAAAVEEGQGSKAPERIDRARELEEAVALYRGDFLEGFGSSDSAAFEDWALLKRDRLRRLMLEAVGQLAGHWEGRGDLEGALDYARRQTELAPWGEEGHRQVMRLLALSGRRGAALAQYEACCRALKEELGVEPGPETRELYERVRDGQVAATVATGQGPHAPPPLTRHNLPAPLTPLVGREGELQEIGERLADPACRLLTLVGPGGSGKTRLAVEAAARTLDRFPDGAHFVSLAPLQSIEAIVPTVGRALGLSFQSGGGDPRQQLLDSLRSKSILLLLDNYEHLLAGADLVTEVLEAGPQVKILTTSRASLNVQGEHQFAVGPLGLPEQTMAAASEWQVLAATEHGAVHLFVVAAQRVSGDFQLTADNLPHVVQVCQLVQGMPLGILLAAAWVKTLGPAEIAAEITRSLDFLETDWRDVPERQRSMRAVFDHSWRLLSESERAALQGLSVFRGSFDRQAAQAVARVTLRDLMGLVQRSLLARTSEGRYEVHELLRQYATDKLAQTEDGGQGMRDRYCDYYVAALEQWNADLRGPRQRKAMDELDEEMENVWAAWNWAVERLHVDRLDRAMDCLSEFFYLAWRSPEGEAAFRLAAEAFEKAAGDWEERSGYEMWVWARLLLWKDRHSSTTAKSAPLLLEKSLILLDRAQSAGQDTRQERAYALLWLGSAARLRGADEEARRLWEESLALFQAVGDRLGMARVLAGLGSWALVEGTYGEARGWLEESLAIGRSMGHSERVRGSLYWLSLLAACQGRLDEAERLAREQSSSVDSAYSPVFASEVLALCGKFAEALSILEKSLQAGVSGTLEPYARAWLGFTEAHLGQYRRARASAGAFLARGRGWAFQTSVGLGHFVLGLADLAEGAFAEAVQHLQDSVAAHRRNTGRYPSHQFVACLAYAARGLGQRDLARQYLGEALRAAVEIGSFFPLIYAAPAYALLLVDGGEVERAVELYALAAQSPFVANSQWFEDVAGKHIASAVEGLPPEVVAAAQERGRARDLWETAQELLQQLLRQLPAELES